MPCGCPGRSSLASLQHVFRRGHIFGWRRVHYSFHPKPIDVRLSLGTPDRPQARNRGAVLTASDDRVVSMLNDRIRASGGMTERELQAIAKAMYEERLAEVCTEQRTTPDDAEYHSATNRAFVDYFQRLTSRGGHMSFLPEEQSALEAQGRRVSGCCSPSWCRAAIPSGSWATSSPSRAGSSSHRWRRI